MCDRFLQNVPPAKRVWNKLGLSLWFTTRKSFFSSIPFSQIDLEKSKCGGANYPDESVSDNNGFVSRASRYHDGGDGKGHEAEIEINIFSLKFLRREA